MPGFQPDWTPDELLAFYEGRVLTPEQCKAIIWYDTVMSMKRGPICLDPVYAEELEYKDNTHKTIEQYRKLVHGKSSS
jgi:hypothetical protein